MRQRKKSILAMYHVTNRIRGMIYVWMDAVWISWGLAQRVRKRERLRENRGKWGVSRTAEIISTVWPDFFPAVIIPFSSSAGHRESLQSVEQMMAQLSLLPSESWGHAHIKAHREENNVWPAALHLPGISTLRKASDGSQALVDGETNYQED